MEEMVNRTQILEEESERLKRLENKMTIAADMRYIHRNTLDVAPIFP
jgi:nitrogen-specific signal transduction histidine kinase